MSDGWRLTLVVVVTIVVGGLFLSPLYLILNSEVEEDRYKEIFQMTKERPNIVFAVNEAMSDGKITIIESDDIQKLYKEHKDQANYKARLQNLQSLDIPKGDRND